MNEMEIRFSLCLNDLETEALMRVMKAERQLFPNNREKSTRQALEHYVSRYVSDHLMTVLGDSEDRYLWILNGGTWEETEEARNQ